MTSAFSWQNCISLCPALFFTPSPNLPVTPDILVWGLILNAFNPSYYLGFSFALAHGVSPESCSSAVQLLLHLWV